MLFQKTNKRLTKWKTLQSLARLKLRTRLLGIESDFNFKWKVSFSEDVKEKAN